MLHLDADEKTALYNATGKQKNSIPPDSHDYIIWHEYVNAALRTSRDIDASEKKWQQKGQILSILFRTCLHKKCVWIFEHNFVADQGKNPQAGCRPARIFNADFGKICQKRHAYKLVKTGSYYIKAYFLNNKVTIYLQ